MTTNNFPTAYNRIQSVTNTRTQTELATFLGIRQSSISDAKRRGEIPASWLVKVLKAYSVNPEWIVTGEGPQYLEGANAVAVDGTHINWAKIDADIANILNIARINISCALRAGMSKDTAP